MLTRTGAEGLLVDEQNGKVHVVNHTAAQLWDLCDGAPTIDQLVVALAAAYDVSDETVRTDVEEIVGVFGDLGLLGDDASPSP